VTNIDIVEITQAGRKNGSIAYGPAKHQAVLALDMDTWEQLIDAFDIQEPMIKHRREDEHRNVGAKGWYA
jgi:hypothetical protein